MAFEDVPRCQHVKVNGVQCASPALRRKPHCFFHERAHYEHKLSAEDKTTPRNFGFPLLEDANSIQVAIMKTVQMLGSGRLDPKIAGLMLYGLQIASSNLRHVEFEPEKPTDVVVDEDTVDLTRLSGPQWSSRDFKEEEKKPESESKTQTQDKDKQDKKDEEDGTTEKQRPAMHTGRRGVLTVAEQTFADLVRRRERKRNLLPGTEDDGKHTLAKHLLDRMVPGWREHGFKQPQGQGEEAAATTP
jgi:hypothetical protein